MTICIRSSRRKASGVALVIVLIFFIILTSIGIFLAKRANLELRMTGNAVAKALTFEQAESARIDAINAANILATNLSSGTSYNCGVAGQYAAAGVSGTTGTCAALASRSLTWTSADSIAGTNGRYAIEYEGSTTIVLREDRYSLPVKLTSVHVFKIASYGTDSTGGRTLLETYYLRRNSGS